MSLFIKIQGKTIDKIAIQSIEKTPVAYDQIDDGKTMVKVTLLNGEENNYELTQSEIEHLQENGLLE